MLDHFGSLFVDWKILTSRQIVRMTDAEFVADLALAIEEGIVSTSPAKLRSLYKKYDAIFPTRPEMDRSITASLEVILTELSELQGTYITKPHVFHSLICALMHNQFGLVGAQQMTGISTTGKFFNNRDFALVSLKRLAAAHEEKDFAEFHEYVQAASGGGNRAPQRALRIKWLCQALQGKFA